MATKAHLQEVQVDEEAGASAVVLIRFRPGEKASVRRALRLLSRCALEIVVQARDADGTHVPAQVAVEWRDPETRTLDRVQEGARWNG